MNLQVNVDKKLLNRLEQFSVQLKKNKGALVLDAIKKHLHTLEMQQIRKQLKGIARKHGFKNENDIFESVS